MWGLLTLLAQLAILFVIIVIVLNHLETGGIIMKFSKKAHSLDANRILGIDKIRSL